MAGNPLGGFSRIATMCILGMALFLASIPSQSNAQDFRWVLAQNGAVPGGAVAGGSEPGRTLFICRARYQGGTHPGKVVGRNCNIGWGGREILRSRYQVMVAGRDTRFGWVRARPGALPRGAVAGGSEPGRTLYICRARYRGGVHPGKIVGRNCNFGWGGKEILLSRYQVLVRLEGHRPTPGYGGRSPGQGGPPPAVYSFGLTNGTGGEVDIYLGNGNGEPAYVGTLYRGQAFARDARAGDIFFFSQNGRWIGSYRVDDRSRRQLFELPSGAIYRFN